MTGRPCRTETDENGSSSHERIVFHLSPSRFSCASRLASDRFICGFLLFFDGRARLKEEKREEKKLHTVLFSQSWCGVAVNEQLKGERKHSQAPGLTLWGVARIRVCASIYTVQTLSLL